MLLVVLGVASGIESIVEMPGTSGASPLLVAWNGILPIASCARPLWHDPILRRREVGRIVTKYGVEYGV